MSISYQLHEQFNELFDKVYIGLNLTKKNETYED